MPDELVEFQNVIVLRNQLCAIELESLLKIYQDQTEYISFLDAFSSLTSIDSGLLALSDTILEKVLSIVQTHRFDWDDPEVRDYINEIILYVNGVKGYSKDKKDRIAERYLSFQEEQRNARFHTSQEFLTSLSYDAIVFFALENGDLDAVKDDHYFLMSLNYFMNVCPGMFADEKVSKNAMQLLDRVKRNSKRFGSKKAYYKKTCSLFQKINQKEE